MCVAFPGEIKAIEGDRARVDFRGNLADVSLGLVTASVGQYVLVHAGCAIQVMEADEAREILQIFDELERNLEG